MDNFICCCAAEFADRVLSNWRPGHHGRHSKVDGPQLPRLIKSKENFDTHVTPLFWAELFASLDSEYETVHLQSWSVYVEASELTLFETQKLSLRSRSVKQTGIRRWQPLFGPFRVAFLEPKFVEKIPKSTVLSETGPLEGMTAKNSVGSIKLPVIGYYRDETQSNSYQVFGKLNGARLATNYWYYKLGDLTSQFREYLALRRALDTKVYRGCLGTDCKKKRTVVETPKNKEIARILDLNTSQASAFHHAVDGLDNVVLVQGPPGTGKTSTVLGMLAGFIEKQPNATILVTAPSNSATCDLAMRFCSNEFTRGKTDRTVLRLARLSRMQQGVVSISPQVLSDKMRKQPTPNKSSAEIEAKLRMMLTRLRKLQLALTSWNQKLEACKQPGERVKILENRTLVLDEMRDTEIGLGHVTNDELVDLLTDASIVFATLNASGSTTIPEEIEFNVVIVDEACQANELSSIIPLFRGCEKLVLVGDPAQLPATVLSKKAEAANFGRSLFSRLAENKKPVEFLSEQYRMHPEICSYISSQFYDNRLITHKSVIDRPEPKWFSSSNDLVGPLRFFHVVGTQIGDASHSLLNPTQAQFACRLVSSMLGLGANPEDIGVICPYKAQVTLIKEGLALLENPMANGHRTVEVATVDSFQGREKSVIIFVTVVVSGKAAAPFCHTGVIPKGRTRPLGFVSNPNRANVAMSRARDSLIVIGDARALERDPTFFGYLRHCKAFSEPTSKQFHDVHKIGKHENSRLVDCWFEKFGLLRVSLRFKEEFPKHLYKVCCPRKSSQINRRGGRTRQQKVPMQSTKRSRNKNQVKFYNVKKVTACARDKLGSNQLSLGWNEDRSNGQ